MDARIVRLARRVRDVAREVHHANKFANAYLLSYGLAETDKAPDTYAEFLLRTPTTDAHEPSARYR